MDSAWEQEKLEAKKMLAVGAARRGAAVPSIQSIIPVIVRDALLARVLKNDVVARHWPALNNAIHILTWV
jgi:hypothetical protein